MTRSPWRRPAACPSPPSLTARTAGLGWARRMPAAANGSPPAGSIALAGRFSSRCWTAPAGVVTSIWARPPVAMTSIRRQRASDQELTSWPSIARMRSPGSRPARAAGVSTAG
ncbi:hypothetical protein G6F65_022727 [Rhizopus arrhizus]|nr:hypothetical protein G6F24_017402 [Rhizopus arrhizus]KAG1242949.1 hypothetical protein G6F65_022727 [Rhizopus arrhizus]